jgi:anti-sigma B factor antagonist
VTVTLAVTLEPQRMTIAVGGEADFSNADQVRAVLLSAIDQAPRRITVDLRYLTFIDSMSIGVLVAARRAALERHLRFTVANPQGNVLRAFQVTGVLDSLIGDCARPA